MTLRTRLTIFLLLFGSAVITNILALFYMARSVSSSLDAIERIRQRQLLTVQMDAHLRDAEAALYRYQIIGETGFKTQFFNQLDNFAIDLDQYSILASDNQEKNWAETLRVAKEQAQKIGNDLINLHDRQTDDLQAFFDNQAQITDLLLVRAQPAHQNDVDYQTSVSAMLDASRSMLSAITGYIASPDETKRVRFTDAIVNFRQAANAYLALAETVGEEQLGSEISTIFEQLQTLGFRLISQRDLQQSLNANFIAITFDAGQQTIVGQIEPQEAVKFTTEQQSLLRTINTAIIISILVVVLISAFTIVFMTYLSRQVNERVDALLRGAERVSVGDLRSPVSITGADEFGRLAGSFNRMMTELASREERLRSLIGKMAQIQDEERRLIGLDLHDGLTQLVISANMHLNALNAQIGSRLDSDSTQELDLSRTLVKQSIDEARKVIAELRPTLVEDFGLEEGLRRYVAEICERRKLSYEVVTELNDVQIPSPVDTAIFRIVQEAMANIRKHSNTSRVRLVLHEQDKSLFLRVQDWGQGFDTNAFEDDMSHLGLVSMQERAQMLGGSCLIQSKKGEGTIVEVIIPLTTLTKRKANVAK